MINKAMEFYDQIEVIPIYNTLLIFMNLLCGSVLLDEYEMYTFVEMFYLLLALCVSVVGIIMLVKKPDLS